MTTPAVKPGESRPRPPVWARRALVLACMGVLAWRYPGVPISWQLVLPWALLLLLLVSPTLSLRRMGRDWLPLVAALAAYQLSRGLADELGQEVEYAFPIEVEQALLGSTSTELLQDELINPRDTAPWEALTAIVYVSHFILPIAAGVLLYLRARPLFARYRALLTATFAIGVAGYVLVPMAPPWLAAREGLIGTVDRVTARGWGELGLPFVRDAIDLGARYTNSVAAMPSLHAAFSVLYLLVLWRTAGSVLRGVLVAYPLAMAFTLMLGGEHYLVDILAGWLVAAGAMGLVLAWERRPKGVERSAPAAVAGAVRAAVAAVTNAARGWRRPAATSAPVPHHAPRRPRWHRRRRGA